MAQLGNLIVIGVTKLLSKLYVSDSVTAPTFIGKLQGNADSATKVNGHTVNSDVPSGAKFTDTNTWRGVQDNLTSTATDQSLSANQGKVLKGLIDGKAASSHTHNYIANPGNHTETASGSTANAPTAGMLYSSGLYMTQNYSDSATPANYGNIINIAGSGTGQIMAEWSGSDNTTGRLYYRSHRDTSTGGWGAWKTVAYTSDVPSVGNGTVTIKQAGTSKGTFTMNQSGNTTIELTDNNTTYSTGTASATGLTKLYTGTGSATDGTMTQSAITSALNGKAASSHTHSYLPLSGGTITGNLVVNGTVKVGNAATLQYDSSAKCVRFVF